MSKVNPQREEGNRQISSAVFEALIKADLSGGEFKVALAIIHKTWGFHKISDVISTGKLQEMTGLADRTVKLVMKQLKEKKIIYYEQSSVRVHHGSPMNEFLFNKHYDTWSLHACKNIHACKDTSSKGAKSCQVRVHDSAPTKESIKEKILNTPPTPQGVSAGVKNIFLEAENPKDAQIGNSPQEETELIGGGKPTRSGRKRKSDFVLPKSLQPLWDEFWPHYPRKQSRAEAEKAFCNLSPSAELVSTMISSVEAFKLTHEWKKDGGIFIPYPASWINGRRWEDEILTQVTNCQEEDSEERAARINNKNLKRQIAERRANGD